MIGLPSTRVGVDAGTANTLVYVEGRGIAVNEPSLLTIRTASGAIEAVGGEAEAARGRTPARFRTARPIRAGIVSDLELFDGMLHCFLRKAHVSRSLRRLEVAVALPSGTTGVERLALVESLQSAGAAEVLVVDEVLAAARGAGLAIEQARGRLVVNIGAGVTDVGIISLGSAVFARAIRVAGDDLDAAIQARVRDAHQLIIGERTAERLKIEIGSAAPLRPELTLAAKGRCAARGVPREATIGGAEIRDALSTPLRRMMSAIREALEQAPPELSADFIEDGVVLTGGSALLRNLDQFIARSFGLPVRVAEDPMSCVIRGLAYQLHHLRGSGWRRFAANAL